MGEGERGGESGCQFVSFRRDFIPHQGISCFRARICRSFKETRYRFSAWRAGTKPYLSYWPARLHRLAKSIPRNRCLGSINVYKYGLRLPWRELKTTELKSKESMARGVFSSGLQPKNCFKIRGGMEHVQKRHISFTLVLTLCQKPEVLSLIYLKLSVKVFVKIELGIRYSRRVQTNDENR